MKRCGRCEREIDESARFCPACGAPQTPAAREELARLVRERTGTDQSETGSDSFGRDGAGVQFGGWEPWTLGGYLLGYATLVVGAAAFPGPGGAAFGLAGLAILPPTRHLLGRPFGRPFKREFMIGSYVVLVLAGTLLVGL